MNSVIEFFDDYSLMISEEKHETTKRKLIKILTLNKCFKDYQ